MHTNEKFGKLPLLRKNEQVGDDDGTNEIYRARTYMQGGKGSGTGLPCATLYARTAIEIVVSICILYRSRNIYQICSFFQYHQH